MNPRSNPTRYACANVRFCIQSERLVVKFNDASGNDPAEPAHGEYLVQRRSWENQSTTMPA